MARVDIPASCKARLSVAVPNFWLSQGHRKTTPRDMQGLDSALRHLLQLLQQPANLTALAAQAHSPPTHRPSPTPASSSAPSTRRI